MMNHKTFYFIFALFSLLPSGKIIAEELSKVSNEKCEEDITIKVREAISKLKSHSLKKFYHEIYSKEQSLKVKEVEINKKNQNIMATEVDLEKKIKKFNDRQKKFIACQDKVEGNKSGRIDKIVNIISQMKPAQAAKILSVQTRKEAIKILSILDPQKASKLFNFMDPETSASLQRDYMNMKK